MRVKDRKPCLVTAGHGWKSSYPHCFGGQRGEELHYWWAEAYLVSFPDCRYGSVVCIWERRAPFLCVTCKKFYFSWKCPILFRWISFSVELELMDMNCLSDLDYRIHGRMNRNFIIIPSYLRSFYTYPQTFRICTLTVSNHSCLCYPGNSHGHCSYSRVARSSSV